jgi:hypothetical protein
MAIHAPSNSAATDGRRRFEENLQPSQDLVEYAKAYARAKPEVVALWCFGLGFVLGWKLKPW